MALDASIESDPYIPECNEWGVIPLTPKTIEVEFQQSFQNQIVLAEGWNFFSVPTELTPSGDQWGELGLNVICDASAMWNDAAQAWVSPVPANTRLMPLEGYWCHVSTATTIPVQRLNTAGGVYLPPVKQLFVGWNDVGLSSYVERKIEHALISIDGLYNQILDWLEASQRYAAYANTGELGGGSAPGTTGTANMNAGEGYFVYASDGGQLAGLQ